MGEEGWLPGPKLATTGHAKAIVVPPVGPDMWPERVLAHGCWAMESAALFLARGRMGDRVTWGLMLRETM